MVRFNRIAALCLALQVLAGPTEAADPSPARVENLCRTLATDRSYKIRLLAARKLTGLARGPMHRDRHIIKSLTLALEDRRAIVRAMAARGLGAHEATSADEVLKQVARHDPDRAVRAQARRARKRIIAAKRHAKPRPTFALGTVSMSDARPTPFSGQAALKSRLKAAVRQHLIKQHGPSHSEASVALRLDLRIDRVAADNAEVVYEVQVLVSELPQLHLRHSSMAVARAHAKRRGNGELEAEVALQATQRALEDALATAQAPRAR